MKYNELNEELKTKVDACKTPEDVIKLAKEEGYELSDDELDSIAGGYTGTGTHRWSKSCWGYCYDQAQ